MQFQVPPQLGQMQGRVAQLWGSRPQFIKENPLLIGAGLLGGVAVNNAVGNPMGGLLDTVTFGATNFGGDEPLVIETMNSPVISAQPTSVAQLTGQPMSQPTGQISAQQYALNAEDKARALTNLKRKIATDLITIHALKGMPEDV